MKVDFGAMLDSIFDFETMLTPIIIVFIYWVMILSTLVFGISMIVSESFIKGVAIIIAGGVGSRVCCELLIILFKINENLQKIANKD